MAPGWGRAAVGRAPARLSWQEKVHKRRCGCPADSKSSVPCEATCWLSACCRGCCMARCSAAAHGWREARHTGPRSGDSPVPKFVAALMLCSHGEQSWVYILTMGHIAVACAACATEQVRACWTYTWPSKCSCMLST